MVCRRLPDIAAQAERIAAAMRGHAGVAAVAVLDGVSQMGGGSLPGQDLPTRLVAVRPADISPDELAARLRRHNPPVFTRISRDQVLVDPRTLLEGEEGVLVAAILQIADCKL